MKKKIAHQINMVRMAVDYIPFHQMPDCNIDSVDFWLDAAPLHGKYT